MYWHKGDGLTHTRNHWADRTEWAGGRRQLTFHLVFGPDLTAATTLLRERVADLPAMDAVPAPWLHLTMTALGFTDEVDPDAADGVADEVFGGLRPADELSFDTLLLGAEGPLLCPQPSAWLDEAVRVQREAVDRHLGVRSWRPFRPHVSLAYANDAVPIGDVADALAAPAEATEPFTVRPTLALLEQECSERVYRWRVLRTELVE